MFGFILIATVIACVIADFSFDGNWSNSLIPKTYLQNAVRATSDTWENIQMVCPNNCVCQQSHFMDLSIARWIQTKQNGFEATVKAQTNDNENEV